MSKNKHTAQLSISDDSSRIEKYFYLLDLLKRYVKEPDVVISEIVASKSDERFVDLEEGLRGEFTRNKAIEFGKKYIVDDLAKLYEEIKDNSKSIKDLFKQDIKDLYDAYNITVVGVDFNHLEVKLDYITKSDLTIRYAVQKANGVMSKFIPKYDSKLNGAELLYKLASVVNIGNNSGKLKEYLSSFKEVSDKLSKVIFHSEDTFDKVKSSFTECVPNQLNTTERISAELHNVKMNDIAEDQIVSSISRLVENLKEASSVLESDIENTQSAILDNGTEPYESILKYLLELNTDTVVKFINSELTESEYTEKIDHSKKVVFITLAYLSSFISKIVCELEDMKYKISMFDEIRDITSEVVVTSTAGISLGVGNASNVSNRSGNK